MTVFNSLFSPAYLLNEQIARQIFDVISEHGPIIVIADKAGNFWPSDSQEFSKLNISEEFLKDLTAQIDDGTEPVVTQWEEISIIASQLATDHTNCGYIILMLPKYSPESTLANIGLIEILLNQITVIARLIEKNNRLYELQLKHVSTTCQKPFTQN